MQHSKSLFKLLAFLIITCVGTTVSAQSLDDIVAKHVKAMGGAKLGQLQSMKISAEMDIRNMKGPIPPIIVQNNGFRSESDGPQRLTGPTKRRTLQAVVGLEMRTPVPRSAPEQPQW